MKKYLLPLVIALSALSVSISAAFYSVTGLSMLFAGASVAVLIMASSLEVAKLVIASLLYQYWDKLNKVLRTYLTIAACVLVLITSAGIYGFLSSAYQTTANKASVVDQEILALETKKGLYEDTRDGILKEKQSLAELKGSLSKGSTTQYTDRRGNLVVRSNKASIAQIDQANKSDEKLTTKLDNVNDSIFALETKILEVKTSATTESELGPLKYLSGLTGTPMDKIINWFLLVIIFVFDPLAISLVIAANFAFAQIRKDPIYESTEEDKELLNTSLVDETIEWDEYGNPSPIIKEEEPKQNGVPVMVDPKTGKFFYEEPDAEPINLDLDGDGIIEEEEIKEVFDQVDTNDDGFIDENEAKQSNLSVEDADRLNEIITSLQELEKLNNENNYDFQWKKDKASKEIDNLKRILMKQFNSEDDNTIRYF